MSYHAHEASLWCNNCDVDYTHKWDNENLSFLINAYNGRPSACSLHSPTCPVCGVVLSPPDAVNHDAVNHPAHYTQGGIEVIDAIEAWGLGFNLGNVVKYVARSAHKGRELEDLRKAAWYLARAIACLDQPVVKP